MTALGRLMLKIGKQREKRRQVLASVVNSVFLYEVSLWVSAVHWVFGSLGKGKRIQCRQLYSIWRFIVQSHRKLPICWRVVPFEFNIQEKFAVYWKKKEVRTSKWRRKKKKISTELRKGSIAQWEEKFIQSTKRIWIRKLILGVVARVGRRYNELNYYLTQVFSGYWVL